MKATIDVPDELYRLVKAKSALEGRAIREVTTELFESYVRGSREPAAAERGMREIEASTEAPLPTWLGLARRHLEPGANHDWETIRSGIERGWAGEVAEPPAESDGREQSSRRPSGRKTSSRESSGRKRR